jgi:hypothetical protein
MCFGQDLLWRFGLIDGRWRGLHEHKERRRNEETITMQGSALGW